MIFFIALGSVSLIVGLLIYYFLPAPTCTDKNQNQGEESVDCGGPCGPCIKQPKDIVRLWTRVFEIKEGVYDAAALVENPNLSYAMPLFKYTFRLYDSKNVVVAIKEGQSFLGPQDKFVILEPSIEVGGRKPTRADMEVEYLSNWQYLDKKKPSLIVSNKKFSNISFASLEVNISNQSIFPVNDVQVAAVLSDEKGSAVGASVTRIDAIKEESSRVVVFTWSKPFLEDLFLSNSEIFIRMDLSNFNFGQ